MLLMQSSYLSPSGDACEYRCPLFKWSSGSHFITHSLPELSMQAALVATLSSFTIYSVTCDAVCVLGIFASSRKQHISECNNVIFRDAAAAASEHQRCDQSCLCVVLLIISSNWRNMKFFFRSALFGYSGNALKWCCHLIVMGVVFYFLLLPSRECWRVIENGNTCEMRIEIR